MHRLIQILKLFRNVPTVGSASCALLSLRSRVAVFIAIVILHTVALDLPTLLQLLIQHLGLGQFLLRPNGEQTNLHECQSHAKMVT